MSRLVQAALLGVRMSWRILEQEHLQHCRPGGVLPSRDERTTATQALLSAFCVWKILAHAAAMLRMRMGSAIVNRTCCCHM